jgi:hypothetical protein
MRTRILLAVVLVWFGLAACGAVEEPVVDAPPVDTSIFDSPDVEIDAPASDIDAPMSPVDAATDAPACQFITIAQCNTNGTIDQFCPTNTRVNQLRRCDGTLYTPDAQYRMFHLCNCTAATCGCNSVGVAWQQVECCPL